MTVRRRIPLPALLLSLPAAAQLVLTEGTNIVADAATDGRIVMDLLGAIWLLPDGGGDARRIVHGAQSARRPRWSPDGVTVLYETAGAAGGRLWLYDPQSGESYPLGAGEHVDQHPSWHPSGERVVFSSARDDGGFDLWERDLPSGLCWRLTQQAGDETEPAWSANGRHLAWIHRRGATWSLMLRRFGEPDLALLTGPEPLYAPAWRPDGSLLTYLRETPDGLVLNMAILAEPPLLREMHAGEDFFVAPLAWLDRKHYLYTADGVIKRRAFDDRRATRVPFNAVIEPPDARRRAMPATRRLPLVTPPSERLVIRAARLFDGSGSSYRRDTDVLIDGGSIAAVARRRVWDDAVLLDLGEATILPGFIDSYSALPPGDPATIGVELLAWGVTTVVSDDRPDLGSGLWESASTPGPRLLRARAATAVPPRDAVLPLVLATLPADAALLSQARLGAWRALGIPLLAESWNTGLTVGADLLAGAGSLPSSPRGIRYQDVQIALGSGPVTLLSGLADAATPGLEDLLGSRQARAQGRPSLAPRRYDRSPRFDGAPAAVVLGSKPNGLPPGLALHAEFRALAAAGLGGAELLASAGRNAASLLGVAGQIGELREGALADLVVVAGDPLESPAGALQIVAVVRNGRFYSLVSLLERIQAARAVE